MADGVAITAGSGTTVNTDDVGGVHTQRVKVTWGPDGTVNDADVATGKPVPIQVRSATGLVPIGEPTDAKSTATDGTSASLVAIAKQISASAQLSATAALQGALTETAPATDTASSGLNGRLQRIAQNITSAVSTALPAGENHFGAIGGNTSHIDVTLSLDTSAYAIGDLMADTQVVTNAMRINDGTGVLQSIQVLDEDDQGIAFDLVFLAANNTLGTENSAPSVSDANARDILGFVSVASVDYIDLGGSRIATKTNVGLICKPAAGTRNLYVGAITRGAPTYTASGVKLRLGFLQD